jgi:hypothetical protein
MKLLKHLIQKHSTAIYLLGAMMWGFILLNEITMTPHISDTIDRWFIIGLDTLPDGLKRDWLVISFIVFLMFCALAVFLASPYSALAKNR